MVVRRSGSVRAFISIPSKSALAATIAFVLAGCQNKAPESVKPLSTAPVFSSENLAERTIERRAVEAVIWGMPAVNFDRMYQAMVHDANAGEGSNKVVYLVSSLELEKPDSHAQPGHHLPHAFLQHQGRGAGGDGDSARRRRLDHRLSGRLLADRHRGRRPRRRRQRKRRQVPDLASRLQRPSSLRIHPHAIRDLPELCAASFESEEQQ